jgi:hypothetical protein
MNYQTKATFFEEPDPVCEEWCEIELCCNPHRRKLPPNKRITIESGDGLLQLMQKGEKLWGAAGNNGQGS